MAMRHLSSGAEGRRVRHLRGRVLVRTEPLLSDADRGAGVRARVGRRARRHAAQRDQGRRVGSVSQPAPVDLCAYGTAYTTSVHPALPNYLELTSGNPQGVACDCLPGTSNTCTGNNCTLLAQSCTCPQSVSHLGDELDVAGIPWREYAESMGAPCSPGDAGALFAANHVPFLYYSDVFTNSGRCQQRVVDFTAFAGDLTATIGEIVRFALISPNVCNDMHSNCTGDPVRQGDTWLAGQVPADPRGRRVSAPEGGDVLFIDQRRAAPAALRDRAGCRSSSSRRSPGRRG